MHPKNFESFSQSTAFYAEKDIDCTVIRLLQVKWSIELAEECQLLFALTNNRVDVGLLEPIGTASELGWEVVACLGQFSQVHHDTVFFRLHTVNN